MRALLIALAVVLAVTAVPPTARALPVADLCTPDLARGGVPADFVVDACVDATTMTLRNDLERPVLVRREGDVGAPVRVHERGSSAATVLTLLEGADELLMPGDVARWPLGPATGTLTVVDVDPVVRSVVDAVTTRLPGLGSGEEKDVRPFVAVIRELDAAVQERSTCIDGKNFLRRTACDMDAASRISRTLTAQLTRSQAAELVPLVLDRTRWTAWTTPTPAGPSSGSRGGAPATRTLTQAPVPVPAPAVAEPAVVPPPVTAPPPVAVSAPPVPAPVVPAPPRVAAAVPAPAPAPPPVPAPTVNHNLDAWWASVLQQLAAQQNSPSISGSDGSPKGHGGHGHR